MGFREKCNPSTDLEHLSGEFDELLEHLGSDHRNLKVRPTASNRPPVESFIEGDNFVVRFRLPGVHPKHIDVQVVDEILTIKASLFRDEIRYGSFERAIGLPQGVKAEHLNAVHQDGVLELRAPMPGKFSAKAIKVQVEEKKPAAEKRLRDPDQEPVAVAVTIATR
jgi:HSP20 family molecular chaperone IbpA